MSGGGKGYTPPSRAELQAMRDAKTQTVQSEADRREKSFLRNVTAAGDDLEWILLNQAWIQLGYEYFGDWWEKRVLPVLVKLDLRPSQELADRIIAMIQSDESGLPAAQRRTQREIAACARSSRSKVSRSPQRADARGSDLDNTAAVTPPGVPADGGNTPEEPNLPKPPASGPSSGGVGDGPGVTPGFTEDQRETAARRLANFESGALAAVGPVNHWSDVSCIGEGGNIVLNLGKTTCLDCLRAVVASETAAGGPSVAPPVDGTDEARQSLDVPAGDGPGCSRPVPGNPDDSSPEASEASPQGEAPAGGTVNPSPEQGPAVATPVEPGIDHLVGGPGEAPMPPSAAGVTPLVGDGVDRDEVEGEAEHSPSTDPAALLEHVAGFITGLREFEADVIGPLLGNDALVAHHEAADEHARFVGLLERWRNS